jgi:hypothetical protein
MISQVRRAILMVLAVILMFATIPSVFTIPSEAYLFRPDPYQQAIRNQQFFQSFPGWMAELVVEGDLQGMEDMPPALQNLQYEEYEQMLRAVLPPQWLAAEIDAVIEEFWEYMNFQTNQLSLVINLDEPKNRLVGPGSDVVVQTIMNTWPECTPTELQGILQDMETGAAGSMPLCRPPLEYRPAFVETVRSGLQIFSTMLPDRISLVELLEIVEETGEVRGLRFSDLFDTYRTLRGVMRISPLIMAVLMLLIGLFAIGRPRAFLTGWGGPLLIGGIVGMVIAVVLGLAGNLIAESLVRELTVTRPAGMFQALVAAVRSVVNRFTLYTSLSGLIAAVVGAGMFLFGRFYPGRHEEEEQMIEEQYQPYQPNYPAAYPTEYQQDVPQEYAPEYPEYPVQYPPDYDDYQPRYPDEAPTIYPEEPLEPYSEDDPIFDPGEIRRSYPDDAETRYTGDEPTRYPDHSDDEEIRSGGDEETRRGE